MDAKVKQIPFKLRGVWRKLNEVIRDVTPDEMTHFGDYLKEVQTKTKKEVNKDVEPKTKT